MKEHQAYESITAPFPADEEQPYIFVSYSHRDRKRIFPILRRLYEKGWRFWYDEGLEIGDAYDEVLRAHEENCALFLLFVTSQSVDSCYINRYELPQALEFGKTILVCQLDDGAQFADFDLSACPRAGEDGIEQLLESAGCAAKGEEREARPRRILLSPAVAAKDAEYEFGRCVGGVRLLRYRGGDSVVHVPEEYPAGSGLKVLETSMTFFDQTQVTEVHFPPTLQRIGMATFGCVYDPGAVTDVYVPSSVTQFDENWCAKLSINPVQKRLTLHCAPGSAAYSVGSRCSFVTIIRDDSMAVREMSETAAKTYACASYTGERGRALADDLREKGSVVMDSAGDASGDAQRLIRGCACFIAFVDRGYLAGKGVEELRLAFALEKRISLYYLDDSVLPEDLAELSEQHSLKYDAGTEEERAVRLANWLSANSCRELSQIPDFEYIVENGGIYLTRYHGGPHAVIEPEYGGLPVTVIFPGAFKGRRDLLTIEIPEGVEEIGDEAFLGCSGLDTVYLPDSITKIGPRAFKECSSLTAVHLPEHVEALHYSVFDACRSLAAIDVPAGVRTIGNNAFDGCTGLRSLTLHEGLRELGVCMLQGCTGLYELTVPGTVEKIGRMTLSHCRGLRKVVLQEGVKEIEESAFFDSRNLEYVQIPQSVTVCPDGAFAGCSSLKVPVIPEEFLVTGWKQEEQSRQDRQREQKQQEQQGDKPGSDIGKIINPLRLAAIALDKKGRWTGEEKKAAVGRIRSQALLRHILNNTRYLDVQIAVVGQLTSQEDLGRIAQQHMDPYVRMAAVRRLESRDILRQTARGDEDADVRIEAVRRLESGADRELLLDISKRDPREGVRLAALEQLGDADVFRELLAGTPEGAKRLALIRRVQTQALLARMALEDPYTLIREAACARLEDRELLGRIAAEDREPWIRRAAAKRLKELDAEE